MHTETTIETDSHIPFVDFIKASPVLYGQMTMNGKVKIGTFKKGWNSFSNSAVYNYYGEGGHKGKGGFTLKRAWELLINGQLSTNPENGKRENYL